MTWLRRFLEREDWWVDAVLLLGFVVGIGLAFWAVSRG